MFEFVGETKIVDYKWYNTCLTFSSLITKKLIFIEKKKFALYVIVRL